MIAHGPQCTWKVTEQHQHHAISASDKTSVTDALTNDIVAVCNIAMTYESVKQSLVGL